MMRLSLSILVVAATCILAQNSSYQTSPPDCALPCVTKYLDSGAAGFCDTGEGCFCQDPAFWADITCCFGPSCTADEDEETYDYLIGYCRQIGSRSLPEIEGRNPVGCPEIPSSIYAAAVPTATGSLQASATPDPTLNIGGLSTLAETGIAVAVLIVAALLLILFYKLRQRSLDQAKREREASAMPKPVQPVHPAPPVPFEEDIELPPYSRTDEGWGRYRSDGQDTMGEPVKPFETV